MLNNHIFHAGTMRKDRYGYVYVVLAVTGHDLYPRRVAIATLRDGRPLGTTIWPVQCDERGEYYMDTILEYRAEEFTPPTPDDEPSIPLGYLTSAASSTGYDYRPDR